MFWLAATLINVSTTQYFLKIITQPPVNRHCRSCAIPNPNTTLNYINMIIQLAVYSEVSHCDAYRCNVLIVL